MMTAAVQAGYGPDEIMLPIGCLLNQEGRASLRVVFESLDNRACELLARGFVPAVVEDGQEVAPARVVLSHEDYRDIQRVDELRAELLDRVLHQMDQYERRMGQGERPLNSNLPPAMAA